MPKKGNGKSNGKGGNGDKKPAAMRNMTAQDLLERYRYHRDRKECIPLMAMSEGFKEGFGKKSERLNSSLYLVRKGKRILAETGEVAFMHTSKSAYGKGTFIFEPGDKVDDVVEEMALVEILKQERQQIASTVQYVIPYQSTGLLEKVQLKQALEMGEEGRAILDARIAFLTGTRVQYDIIKARRKNQKRQLVDHKKPPPEDTPA